MQDQATNAAESSPWKLAWQFSSVIAILGGKAMGAAGWLPYPLASALLMAVCWIAGYWIRPRPQVTFVVWVAQMLALLGYILLGCWIVPPWLDRWISAWAAYSLPPFATSMSLYWVPPVRHRRKRGDLRIWLLFSLGVAALMGLAAHFAPDS